MEEFYICMVVQVVVFIAGIPHRVMTTLLDENCSLPRKGTYLRPIGRLKAWTSTVFIDTYE
jgi:hypothetical protein